MSLASQQHTSHLLTNSTKLKMPLFSLRRQLVYGGPYTNYFDYIKEQCRQTSGLRLHVLRYIIQNHIDNPRFMAKLYEKNSLPSDIKKSLIEEINTEIIWKAL